MKKEPLLTLGVRILEMKGYVYYVCVFMGQFLVNAVADQWQDPWACSTGGQCPEEGKEGGFTIRDTVVGSSEPLDSIFFCQLISI